MINPSVVPLHPSAAKNFIIDHLRSANLRSSGHSYRGHPDQVYDSNEQFWQQIINNDPVKLHWVNLQGFRIIDWYPRLPGIYHTALAREIRVSAEDHIVHDRDGTTYFDPFGKTEMINGGIGTVRFKPIKIESEDCWLCTATSDDFCHTGIPLFVPQRLLELVSFDFKVSYDIAGQVRFLPAFFERTFSHSVGIPQVYVLVDRIRATGLPQRPNPVRITPIAFYAAKRDGKYVHTSGCATYVTCESGSTTQLDRAADWIGRYVAQYGEEVVTNYDEQRPTFPNAPFSLQKVMTGTCEVSSLPRYCGRDAEMIGETYSLLYSHAAHSHINEHYTANLSGSGAVAQGGGVAAGAGGIAIGGNVYGNITISNSAVDASTASDKKAQE